MNLERPITDRITIADQPSAEDLARLKKEGYVAVVNLRNDGEPEQPMSVADEGKEVAAQGMAYHHYTVEQPPLTESGVTGTADFIDRESANGKVLVHCRKGSRAAALVLLQQARAHGWKPDEVLAKGRAVGLELPPPLQAKVEQYLKSQG